MAVLDAEGVMQGLGQRCHAVGGAGGIAQHRVFGGDQIVVHTVDNCFHGVFTGGRDDDPFRSIRQMFGRRLARGEDAGAFQHDVHIAPRQGSGVAFCGHADRALAHIHRVVAQGDRTAKAPVDRVEFEQMCVGFQRGEIVDRHHLQIIVATLHQRAQHVTTDTAKAIDCQFGSHGASS